MGNQGSFLCTVPDNLCVPFVNIFGSVRFIKILCSSETYKFVVNRYSRRSLCFISNTKCWWESEGYFLNQCAHIRKIHFRTDISFKKKLWRLFRPIYFFKLPNNLRKNNIGDFLTPFIAEEKHFMHLTEICRYNVNAKFSSIIFCSVKKNPTNLLLSVIIFLCICNQTTVLHRWKFETCNVGSTWIYGGEHWTVVNQLSFKTCSTKKNIIFRQDCHWCRKMYSLQDSKTKTMMIQFRTVFNLCEWYRIRENVLHKWLEIISWAMLPWTTAEELNRYQLYLDTRSRPAILLHDLKIANTTQQLWNMAYSPDISLSDYHVFHPIQYSLPVYWFQQFEDIEWFLESKPGLFYYDEYIILQKIKSTKMLWWLNNNAMNSYK